MAVAYRHRSGLTEYLLSPKEERLKASEDVLVEIAELARSIRLMYAELLALIEVLKGGNVAKLRELNLPQSALPAKFLIKKKMECVERRIAKTMKKMQEIKRGDKT